MGKEVPHWERSNYPDRDSILPIYLIGVVLSTALIVVLLISCIHTVPVHSRPLPSNPGSVAVETEIHDFALHGNAPSVLIVHNNLGFLHVHSARDQHSIHIMVVKTMGTSGDAPENIQVAANQSGNTLTIQVNHQQANLLAMNDARADMDVTLPVQSNLELETTAGNIEVADVEGTMSLRSGTGSIQATGISLTGNSQLRTNIGGISFRGSLHGGSYQFQSVAGNIDVTLPASSSFHLNARATLGFFASDFSGVVAKPMIVGASASGDIGTHSSTLVTLVSNTGIISLKRAK